MVKNIQRNSSVVLLLALLFSCVRVANPVPDKNTKGKLEQVLERGVLKVVTDFNSSSYFIYRGQPMGFQYDMLQELADYLGVSLEVVVNNDLEEKFNVITSYSIHYTKLYEQPVWLKARHSSVNWKANPEN